MARAVVSAWGRTKVGTVVPLVPARGRTKPMVWILVVPLSKGVLVHTIAALVWYWLLLWSAITRVCWLLGASRQ